MANNFSFHPMGLSTQVTVTASQSTVSLNVVRSGGTTLTVGSSGNYQPSAVRIANPGSIAVFLSFGDSTVTTGLSGGLMMLPASVEVFGVNGAPFIATLSGGTTTINITPGEGQ